MVSSPFQDIIDAENDVLEKTFASHSKEIEVIKSIIDEIINVLHFLLPTIQNVDKNNIPSKDFMILTTTSKMNIRAISILNLVVKGYYQEAIILLRSIFEDYA